MAAVDGAADSDSRNLATLLLLRDLQTKRMGPQPLTRKSRSSEHRIRPSEHCTLSDVNSNCMPAKRSTMYGRDMREMSENAQNSIASIRSADVGGQTKIKVLLLLGKIFWTEVHGVL